MDTIASCHPGCPFPLHIGFVGFINQIKICPQQTLGVFPSTFSFGQALSDHA